MAMLAKFCGKVSNKLNLVKKEYLKKVLREKSAQMIQKAFRRIIAARIGAKLPIRKSLRQRDFLEAF